MDAPTRIWLQHDPNDEMGGQLPDDWETADITWCWHRIGESDAEYILAAEHDCLMAEKDARIAELDAQRAN